MGTSDDITNCSGAIFFLFTVRFRVGSQHCVNRQKKAELRMVFYIYIFLFLVEERIDSTWHHSLVGLGNKMLTLTDFCFITQYYTVC